MKRIFLGALKPMLALVLASCASAPGGGNGRAQPQAMLEEVASARSVPAVSVAVRRNGSQLWAGAVGSADETGSAVTTDTLFPLASISKTFMAMLVMDLVQDDILDLDDPVSRWVPGFPNGKRITIRQLMTHTSGVTASGLAPEDWTAKQLRDGIGEPACEPGSCYHYETVDYVTLGVIVERATKDSVMDQLRRRVLKPAGITRLYLSGEEPVPGPVARSFAEDGQSFSDDSGLYPNASAARAWWAAAAMVGSAPEIAKGFEALFDGKIVSKRSLRQMLDFDRGADLPCDQFCYRPYGLGIAKQDFAGYEGWGHFGSTGTTMQYFPSLDLTVVVLTNKRSITGDEVLVDILPSLVEFYALAPSTPSG